ncbi:hypothetical protein [Phaeodactylibacter xiamenensis]|uniref:hypothetical protein n=1 Tax=Phaeodactylibacter xiamenensis TaxID=1524460 RepID=UPI0024A9378E|nr:hypothetical protein [Phaeodactylibacter xiamenensis]
MNRTQQEVALKNQHLDALNQSTNNAYVYWTPGTSSMERLASEKMENSTSGPVPDDLSKDDKAEQKQNWKMAAIAVGIAIAVIVLIKYKIIKI